MPAPWYPGKMSQWHQAGWLTVGGGMLQRRYSVPALCVLGVIHDRSLAVAACCFPVMHVIAHQSMLLTSLIGLCQQTCALALAHERGWGLGYALLLICKISDGQLSILTCMQP